MTGRKLTATVVCACALVLAGCGSSSSTLNKKALAAKVNVICDRTNAALKGLQQPTAVTSDAPYFAKIINAVQTEHNAIKALKPATNLTAEVNQYVNSEAKVIAGFTIARGKAQAGQSAAMTSAAQSTEAPGKRLLAAARQLGWTECTKNG